MKTLLIRYGITGRFLLYYVIQNSDINLPNKQRRKQTPPRIRTHLQVRKQDSYTYNMQHALSLTQGHMHSTYLKSFSTIHSLPAQCLNFFLSLLPCVRWFLVPARPYGVVISVHVKEKRHKKQLSVYAP